MSKQSVALICDPHLDNHAMFGTPTDFIGVNSRLEAGMNAMAWIAREISVRNCNYAFVLGDLVHRHGVLTPPVIMVVQDALHNLSAYGRKVTLLAGNHDQDSNGLSCLSAFCNSDSISIAGEGYCLITEMLRGVCIACVPYSADISCLRDIPNPGTGIRVILMHHSFQGAVHGTHEFQPPASLCAGDVPDNCQVYSGHFHKRQELYGGKVVYPGAIMQHEFGEVDYTPGITFLYEDGTTEFVENLVSPRFHIVKYEGDPGMELPGNPDCDYYRFDYSFNAGVTVVGEIMDKTRFAISKCVYDGKIEVRTRIHEVLEDEDVTPSSAVEAYTVLNEKNEVVAKRLVKLGKELLHG